jgi:hypothetical protein
MCIRKRRLNAEILDALERRTLWPDL